MNADFFSFNRNQLAAKIPGALFVLTSYTAMQRSNDTSFPFEQEANFWYLTGIEAADWLIVYDASQDTSWLVAPSIDEAHMLFEGSLSYETAKKLSGVKKIIEHRELDALLRQLAKKHSIVYTVDQPTYADHFNFVLNPSLKKNRQRLERIFPTVQSCRKELASLRSIKQPQEIRLIQKAVDRTTQAFNVVHKNMQTYNYEYEIEADFTHFFRSNGTMGHAYDPIIGSGLNACTLHYTQNNAKLKKPQLVLMDVGARVNGYAADITRTLAFGVATKRQREVHKAVRNASEQIISSIQPGMLIEEYSSMVDSVMLEAIVSLSLAGASDKAALRKYFPHAVSHGLGIDVHDELGQPKTFREGMVLTVEPGIYIPEENIGVRIEDDILITKNGHRNLSAKLSTSL